MFARDDLEEFEHRGRLWFRGLLSDRELSVLDDAVNLESAPGKRVEVHAAVVEALSGDSGLGRSMSLFGEWLVPVRVVAFNKTQGINWGVPWHQDRIIAVAERHEHPDFVNWSKKSGVWHCEPPGSILKDMYFVRVHLDDSGPDDGAMQIALGSHALGPVPAGMARRLAGDFPIEECLAKRGDVLVLKMLTLHCSSPSGTTNVRRVFRVDYAPWDILPTPFGWRGLRTK